MPSDDGSKLKSEGGSSRDYSTYLMCSPTDWHMDHKPQDTASSYQQTKAEDITQEVQPLATSIPGDRVGPQPLRTATIDYGGRQQISRRKDLLWLIARLVKGDNQRIPSWTGFNIKFHSQEPVMQDVVGFLPTINALVTQLFTVN